MLIYESHFSQTTALLLLLKLGEGACMSGHIRVPKELVELEQKSLLREQIPGLHKMFVAAAFFQLIHGPE